MLQELQFLTKQYENAQTKQNGVEFLRELNSYLDLLESNPLLLRVTANINKEHLNGVAELEKRKQQLSFPERELVTNETEKEIFENYPAPALSKLIDARSEGNVSMSRMIYAEDLTMLHSAITKQLQLFEKHHGIYSQYLDYNPDKGILYFSGKEIKFRSQSNPDLLLTFLFSHTPFEKHFFDELQESEYLEGKSPSICYHACEDINTKVQKFTNEEDFLDYSSGKKMYVRINPKYSLTPPQ